MEINSVNKYVNPGTPIQKETHTAIFLVGADVGEFDCIEAILFPVALPSLRNAMTVAATEEVRRASR